MPSTRGRAAGNAVARGDAGGDGLQPGELAAVLIHDGGGKRRHGTGAGDRQGARRTGGGVELLEAANELAPVCEIDVGNPCGDAGLGDPVVLVLEGTGRVHQGIYAGQVAGEALGEIQPVGLEPGPGAAAGQGPGKRRGLFLAAPGDQNTQSLDPRQAPAKTAAENAVAAEDKDGEGVRHAPLLGQPPRLRKSKTGACLAPGCKGHS